jgi:phosphoglucosamine mutase
MPKYPQVKANVPARGKVPSEAVHSEVERLNEELDGRGRILVRRSGTESLIRVLAEAETAPEAENLCARIAALVRNELG